MCFNNISKIIMVKNHIFLIFINIFFINEIFANDILSIPFYKSYPNLKGFSPKEITEKIKEIKLVSDISIGTPLQKIKAKRKNVLFSAIKYFLVVNFHQFTLSGIFINPFK